MPACVALLYLLCPAFVSGQCTALSVHEPIEWQSFGSLKLGTFSISPRAVSRFPQAQYKEESLDELRTALIEKLRARLQDPRLIRPGSLSQGGSAPANLILEGEITYIYQGSRTIIVPLVASSDPSVLEISGTIMAGDALRSRPVLEFMCRGATGGLFVRSQKWMHDNIDKIGDGLNELLLKIKKGEGITDRLLTATRRKSLNPIEAVIRYSPNEWAEQEKLVRQGAANAVRRYLTFEAAATQFSPDGTVLAIWVTRENAELLLRSYKSTLSINHRTVFPHRDDENLDSEQLQQIFSQVLDAKKRVLWVWYVKRGVTYWNKEQLSAGTVLLDPELPDDLKPLRILTAISYLPLDPWGPVECHMREAWLCASLKSAWIYNSVIFVFPGSRNGVSQSGLSPGHGLEVRAQLDNHPVIIRF